MKFKINFLLYLTISLIIAATLIPAKVYSQDSKVAPHKVLRKIKIRHADPQLIYLILTGKANFGTPPEISTGNKGG